MSGHRTLAEVGRHLKERRPPLEIAPSSLCDIRQKFLFHFGALSVQAAPLVREYLAQRGGCTWLIDGTLEPGSAVFFGVTEAQEGMVLGSWKIPTENSDAIARCLRSAAERFGPPGRVIHDLSQAVSQATAKAFPDMPHDVCHYHFARDVGEDLYKKPYDTLSKRLRGAKLRARLQEQRRGQGKLLRLLDAYPLRGEERREVTESLGELRQELRESARKTSSQEQLKQHEIVLKHIDKYWCGLVGTEPDAPGNRHVERTTNRKEQQWGVSKRGLRRLHGRGKLTRDFEALTEEYMLLPNLENSRYVELVLGDPASLPGRLADAAKKAGPFNAWRKRRHPLEVGRLPKRLLRDENLTEKLLETYDAQCQPLLAAMLEQN